MNEKKKVKNPFTIAKRRKQLALKQKANVDNGENSDKKLKNTVKKHCKKN